MKTVVTDLADVPEALRGEYELHDGKFILKLEGDVAGMAKAADLASANERLAEFRDNNRRLNAELGEFKTKYDGLDPAEHQALKDKLAEIEAAGGDKIDETTAKAIAAAVGPLKQQLQEMTTGKEKSDAALDRKELETAIAREGIAGGVSEKALGDFVRRGMSEFVYRDGAPVAMDGDQPRYSKANPDKTLSVGEWVAELSTSAPYFFKKSTGGGAPGGAGGGGGGIVVDASDDDDFLKNLDKIASAEVTFKE